MLVSVDPTRLSVVCGDYALVSKTVDGTFPDYQRAIPTINDKVISFDPKWFIESAKRVSSVATEKTKALKFTLSKDKVTMMCTSPENGVNTEECPCSCDVDGFEIGLNHAYFRDVISAFGDVEIVTMSFSDSSSPILVSSTQKPELTQVIMPMRI